MACVLEQLVLFERAGELVFADEDVVAAVGLVHAHRTGGGGHHEMER